MPGVIAYCSREDHVSPFFATCLARLAQRHPDAAIEHAVGNDVAASRNKVIEAHLDAEWVWYIDSDMTFAAETVERLLRHGADVVQALCVLRHPPHMPVLYEHSAALRSPAPTGPPRLVLAEAVGSGGTLYRMAALKRVARPWFEGIIGREDLALARKLVEAGVVLHTDLSTPVGHVTPMAAWPEYDARTGKWRVIYYAANGAIVRAA